MTLFTKSALALSLSIGLAFGANAAQADSLAIINATVHTATEQGVLNNATVVIENGTITAINPDNPQVDSVIDAKRPR
ncbi:hypothetical protein PEC18_30410 [Paucibacter sp. O1-1]|nr:hypothetical protein [Paucibacter sp. O1-1]MDA3830027.1 hypothetical protein [Paucibacter sp. O1-1]